MPKERIPGSPTTRRYGPEEKAQAVRLVRTLRAELGTEHGTVQRVAAQLGYGVESVRVWVKRADVNDGHALGVTTDESDVVDGRRLGVEPIVRVLREAGLAVAPSSYYAAKSRPASARSVRDAELRAVLRRLWDDNYRVYGARKLWKATRRAGLDVGRDQVARLMRLEGIEGVRRTKRVRTTRPEPGVPRHPDLVGRDFTATAPNQLWVTDLTFVPTWAGMAP